MYEEDFMQEMQASICRMYPLYWELMNHLLTEVLLKKLWEETVSFSIEWDSMWLILCVTFKTYHVLC